MEAAAIVTRETVTIIQNGLEHTVRKDKVPRTTDGYLALIRYTTIARISDCHWGTRQPITFEEFGGGAVDVHIDNNMNQPAPAQAEGAQPVQQEASSDGNEAANMRVGADLDAYLDAMDLRSLANQNVAPVPDEADSTFNELWAQMRGSPLSDITNSSV